ncbi:formate/nitrite transporter family protein [Roseicyclus salinarum]|uniref:formate/nitrite transporter family protein n=1 Tax=Roseicyclus salinarum TaxID=3036773 RepID=UPI003D34E753
MIYEVIRRDGEEELHRPNASLIWSGTAAGVLISFSVLGEAILRSHMPETSWRYLIENLGYSFGFLLVILGRMQLFTENTITTVLPLVARRDRECLMLVLRLWLLVLAANVIGAAAAAAFFAWSGAFSEAILHTIGELSIHATGFPPGTAFLKAIPAGILVAAIVWMMPAQQGNEVLVILLFTWLIGAGDFTHIIAGSVEMWFLLFTGGLAPGPAVLKFFLPVLAGNVAGGTAVFALLAWGQVRAEVEDGA